MRTLNSVLKILCGLCVLFMLSACGSDGSACGEGNDGVPDITDENDLATFWIARIAADDMNQVTGPDPGHRTLVQAHFADFSTYRVILAERLAFSEACFINTSRQVVVGRCELTTFCDTDAECPSGYSCQGDDPLTMQCYSSQDPCAEDSDCEGILLCDPALLACVSPECIASECPVGYECVESRSYPLDVDSVTFGGLAGGDLVLQPEGTGGTIPPEVLPNRAFEQEALTIDVASGSDERDYPAFAETVSVPDIPVLTRLGEHKDPDLTNMLSIGINSTGEEPLLVRWIPAGADYVEFQISPGAGSDTRHMKLRCTTYDDGCLEVPVEALHHLSLDKATNFQLKIERYNFVVHSIREGDAVRAAAMISAGSVYEGTVLR
jgi:hypothetical protein